MIEYIKAPVLCRPSSEKAITSPLDGKALADDAHAATPEPISSAHMAPKSNLPKSPEPSKVG